MPSTKKKKKNVPFLHHTNINQHLQQARKDLIDSAKSHINLPPW